MLRSLLPAVAVGLLGGFIAGKWQIAILRFGDIAADQALPFWRFFLGGGVALAGAGWLAGYLAGGALGRGRGLLSAAGAVVAVAAGAGLFVPGNARPRPDVLFLVTDTTRADHLSVYGYDRRTTRYLEEIAGESVIFRQAMSQGSHTIVTTPCILASVYPSDHGVIGYSSKLWDGFLLVSEILKFAGYSTFGVVTNPHLSKGNGFDQGWDSYEMLGSGTSTAVFAERVNAAAIAQFDSLLAGPAADVPESQDASPGGAEDRTGDVDSAAAPPLPSGPPQDRPGRNPIFGFLFYTDPHTPYATPPDYRSLYDPDWKGSPMLSWVMKKAGPPLPHQLRNLIANYDATITYWDDQLRALADSLETRGLMDNMLLVYTSDHGEEFLEHGGIGHGLTLFEEVVHVPLLFSFPVPVKRPRLPRTHRTVSEVVSSVDIVPTLTDYLRVPVEHEMRGRSAVRLALGGKDEGPEREAMLELILKQYGTFDVRALRTAERKYVQRLTYETSFHTKWDEGDLFFDLTEDPGEQQNLLDERAAEAAGYRARVEAWVEASKERAVEAEEVEPDEEQMERLKALGYVE